jgi:hypothetical protein
MIEDIIKDYSIYCKNSEKKKGKLQLFRANQSDSENFEPQSVHAVKNLTPPSPTRDF